jgi:hypothetical protein
MSECEVKVAPDGSLIFPRDNGTDCVPDTASPASPSDNHWQFPPDDGTTPVEELGPAVPYRPGGGGGSTPDNAVEFPPDKITAPGMLERAGNWFTDLF